MTEKSVPTLGFVHTVATLTPRFEAEVAAVASAAALGAGAAPPVDAVHVVDESIRRTVASRPGVDFDRTVTRLHRAVDAALGLGADAIVVTCTASGPAVDVVAATCPVPLLRIDRALSRHALGAGASPGSGSSLAAESGGGGLVVLTTDAANVDSLTAVFEAERDERSRPVSVRQVPQALDALLRGDADTHDQLVAEAARAAFTEGATVVFGQASMAHVDELLEPGSAVVTSPRAAVAAGIAALAEGRREWRRPVAPSPISQLRRYRIRQGLMADWLQFFRHTLVPLHELVGIPVGPTWINQGDPDEFVWIRRFRSVDSVAEQEAEFFSTPPRAALGDVRGRWVETADIRVLAHAYSGGGSSVGG